VGCPFSLALQDSLFWVLELPETPVAIGDISPAGGACATALHVVLQNLSKFCYILAVFEFEGAYFRATWAACELPFV
jgi:hypothetical protein